MFVFSSQLSFVPFSPSNTVLHRNPIVPTTETLLKVSTPSSYLRDFFYRFVWDIAALSSYLDGLILSLCYGQFVLGWNSSYHNLPAYSFIVKWHSIENWILDLALFCVYLTLSAGSCPRPWSVRRAWATSCPPPTRSRSSPLSRSSPNYSSKSFVII